MFDLVRLTFELGRECRTDLLIFPRRPVTEGARLRNPARLYLGAIYAKDLGALFLLRRIHAPLKILESGVRTQGI
jgi:hypothetical protein